MSPPIVIAHRGASGYLPEHSLVAKALAFGQGANFLEQDVIVTKDGIPIVLHDLVLDAVTDVAKHFPGRAREDGRYYAIDFTWQELQQLRLHERTVGAPPQKKYPQRFPFESHALGIVSLEEELTLIAGMNISTRGSVGIYPEIKSPAWHRKQGMDVARIVLGKIRELEGQGIRFASAHLQCFDPHETRRVRDDLAWTGVLVQLLGENTWHEADCDFGQLRTKSGLQEIANFADGIGVWIPHLCQTTSAGKFTGRPTRLVEEAHECGLFVHAYTVRQDELPEFAANLDDLHDFLFRMCHVDGVFSDFPDKTVEFVRRHTDLEKRSPEAGDQV